LAAPFLFAGRTAAVWPADWALGSPSIVKLSVLSIAAAAAMVGKRSVHLLAFRVNRRALAAAGQQSVAVVLDLVHPAGTGGFALHRSS